MRRWFLRYGPRRVSNRIPNSRRLVPVPPILLTGLQRLLDTGADYVQVHAAAPGDRPFWWSTWKKANPSMAYLPDLEAAIRSEAKAAKRDPTLLASFEALRLNLGTSDTEQEVLIGADLWREIEGDAAMSGPCVWGVDLGTSAAQSAVAAYWPETGALAVLACFPETPTLEVRGRRDGVRRFVCAMPSGRVFDTSRETNFGR